MQVEGSGGKSVLDQTLFSMLVKIRESVAKEQSCHLMSSSAKAL